MGCMLSLASYKIRSKWHTKYKKQSHMRPAVKLRHRTTWISERRFVLASTKFFLFDSNLLCDCKSASRLNCSLLSLCSSSCILWSLLEWSSNISFFCSNCWHNESLKVKLRWTAIHLNYLSTKTHFRLIALDFSSWTPSTDLPEASVKILNIKLILNIKQLFYASNNNFHGNNLLPIQ